MAFLQLHRKMRVIPRRAVDCKRRAVCWLSLQTCAEHRQSCIIVMARWPARAGRADILSLARFVRDAGADGRIGTGCSMGPRGDSGLKNGALPLIQKRSPDLNCPLSHSMSVRGIWKPLLQFVSAWFVEATLLETKTRP